MALFNVILAALLATNFFEPVATLLTKYMKRGTLFWDFIALWGLFAAAYLILLVGNRSGLEIPRAVQAADRHDWRLLLRALDQLRVCLLHGDDLAHGSAGGDFLWVVFSRRRRSSLDSSHDRQWLGFVQMASRGSLARLTDEDDPEKYVFDPKGEFMPKYATRRHNYERDESFTGVH